MQSQQKRTLIAGMLAILSLMPLAGAYAASYTVCDSGCNFTTIASALNTVTSGAACTITVKSPYSGNESVSVKKSGAGSSQTLTIQGDGSLPTVNGITVTGNYVTIGGGTKASPLGFTVTGNSNAPQGAIDVEGNYVQILYNTVYNNNSSTGGGCEIGVNANLNGASGSTYPTYVTVTGNIVYSNLGNPSGANNDNFVNNANYPLINMECEYCTVSQNDISGYSVDGIYPWGHDITISNNYFHDFILPSTCTNCAHMDMVQIWGNGSTGCSGCASAAISYNIYFTGNVGLNITDDLCTLSSDQTATSGTTGIHDWYFENNLIVSTYAQSNIGIPNTRFYNNTFIDNSYYNENMTLNNMYDVSGGWNDAGFVVENNAFITTYNATPFTVDTHTAHSNNYTAVRSGSNYSAVSGWSETNGVNGGNPALVNYSGTDSAGILPASVIYLGSYTNGTNDFRLQSSSPLIGKGANLYSTFTMDSLGNTLPSSGNWDIGAYGYTTSLTAPSGLHLVN